MKNLFLGFLIMIPFSLAQAKLQNKARESFRKPVYKCVRDIIESKRYTNDLPFKLEELLRKSQKGDVVSLTKECNAILKTSKTLKELSYAERSSIFEKAINSGPSPILRFLSDVAFKKTGCHMSGASISAAMIAGVKAGLSVGSCRTTAGRVYLAVAPTIGYALGIGAAFNIYADHYLTIYESEPSESEETYIMAFGISMEIDDIEAGDPVAVGAGVGYMHTYSSTFPFKLVPVGNNFSGWDEMILRDSTVERF